MRTFSPPLCSTDPLRRRRTSPSTDVLLDVLGGFLFLEADIPRLALGVTRDPLQGGDQLVVGQPSQVAVDQPLVVADHALDARREAHVLEALGMKATLLARDVG